MNILELTPTTISKDLRGKYALIYSKPKLGKTTMASQFPDNLLVAFEMGYNALGGIMAVPIMKWVEFKTVLAQLKTPAAQARYKTISIDTVAIAWEKCEEYICQQNGVATLGDIEWGKGYALCKTEFANAFRTITMLGYGLVFIAHEEIKVIKTKGLADVEMISPLIPKRAYEIVNGLVDIIGYIGVKENEDGTTQRVLCTRGTPTLVAGSRFKYMSPVIPFGYEELVNALNDAIEKSERIDGVTITNQEIKNFEEEETRSFSDTMEEAGRLWMKALDSDPDKMGPLLSGIVETYFGQPIKLSTATEKQQDLVEMVILDIKKLLEM
jgi:hypothetical protein